MAETPNTAPSPVAGASSMPGAFIFSLLMLAVSLVLFHQASEIAGWSSLSSAGVFPMLAAGTMVVSGLAIAVRTFRERRAARGADTDLREIATFPILAFAALTVAYLFALQPLGFVISSYLFLLLATGFLYRKRFAMLALLNAVLVGVIYLVFRYVFVVILPRGVFL